ncbi:MULTISPECIES: winged helix-turn-helix domain-containing protein [unclassified Methanosarcina]|uniref:helix-turn-helix transcriptional regulator n=1 Tax=unclassified Methanosarcina TaxID=2644672 RepID=UPI000615657C|nr:MULTISPECIES: winged helix-turn-helix domain-containing protein [unclassified Methanosarcina]AKB19617.1 Transcriptional regulator, ArsR family [Methanosarcina sp. WWM596]AKB22654.1 Transcriptional regulator, ArsR family [Methanosarcina sp. WH1]
MREKIKLTELVFLSDKRKKLLLFLKDKPRTMAEIQEHLSADPVSILPQIKKLKEGNLVVQKEHTYELSLMGDIIADKMPPFLDTLEVLEENFDYWTKRNLEGIPPFLRKRLFELKNCKLILPEVSHMFELNPEFVKKLHHSTHILGFASYFHPSFTTLYPELAKKGVEISLVFTEPVFQRFKKDYREELCTFLNFENARVFIFSQNPKIADFTVTDKFFLLTLFPKKKFFEHESLLSSAPEALKWGTDLFSHMLKEAIQVKKV